MNNLYTFIFFLLCFWFVFFFFCLGVYMAYHKCLCRFENFLMIPTQERTFFSYLFCTRSTSQLFYTSRSFVFPSFWFILTVLQRLLNFFSQHFATCRGNIGSDTMTLYSDKHVCHLCKKDQVKIRAVSENNVVFPFVCLPIAVEMF